MRYEGRVFRPPSEAYSLIVQATIGCSHNGCTFCDMYKEKKFRIRKTQDVLEDFALARQMYRHVERIFLADGDALIMKMSQLEPILLYIKEQFPECKRVGIYASPKSLLIKSVEELRRLYELGIKIVYLGLETGSDIILSKVNKGATAKEMIEGAQKVKEAGMELSVSAISGLGGKELWEEHAVQTGKVFTAMKPHYIALLTLLIEEGTPFYQEYKEGKITLLSPVEVAKETLLMLNHMDCEGSVFRSNHASNYISLAGTLNKDKQKLIDKLEYAVSGNVVFKNEHFRGF